MRPREEQPAPGLSLQTILPVVSATPAKPPKEQGASHGVAVAAVKTERVELDCSAVGCGGLRRRLCSGWSGILCGLLMSGGLLAAIYYGTAYIQDSTIACTSIQECGELFPERYVCTTPRCNSTVYTLAELQHIAQSRAYRKVDVDLSWAAEDLTLAVNDHHDLECTQNATGETIYLAAERASLACIGAKIDALETSVDYILGTETALLFADEWCAVDDAEVDYCNTDRCSCGLDVETFEAGSGFSPAVPGVRRLQVLNATSGNATSGNATSGNATVPECTNLVNATAYGQQTGDVLRLQLYGECE